MYTTTLFDHVVFFDYTIVLFLNKASCVSLKYQVGIRNYSTGLMFIPCQQEACFVRRNFFVPGL